MSKEASGPQLLHPLIRFGLNGYFKKLKLKTVSEIFFLYKLRKSFVFFAKKYRVWGSTYHDLSEMNLMFLESERYREWEQLVS